MIINSHCCDYASVTPSVTTATILVTSMSSGLVTHLSPHLQKNLLPLALSQKQYPNDVSKTDTYKYFCFSNCTCIPSFTHLLQHLSHHLSPYLSPHLSPHQQKKHCKHFTIPLQNIPCDKCWKNPSRNSISSKSRHFVLQSHLHIAVSANFGFYRQSFSFLVIFFCFNLKLCCQKLVF